MHQNEKKKWYNEQVIILKKWGEQASCYRYMHYKAYKKYKKSSMGFTLPIIIISTLTGTANFAQETFPDSWKHIVPVGIGGMNLIAAIMTTILQFLKINELMESNRVSSIHYGKLSRVIRLQLSMRPDERNYSGSEFIEYCHQEYDRLIEQSPAIPGKIMKNFEKEYPDMNEILSVTNQKSCFSSCCCGDDDIIQKDTELNLERPEIIKLSVIKPFENIESRNITPTPTPKGENIFKKIFNINKKPDLYTIDAETETETDADADAGVETYAGMETDVELGE